MKKSFRVLVFHSPVKYIICCVIAIVISIVILAQTSFSYLINYVNAFTTAGGALIFLGLLSLVTFYGAFDTMGYAFSTFRTKRRYHDLVEYTNAKEEKRKHSNLSFMPYLVTGITFLCIGLLLLAINNI